jgi:hypothetical protein
MNSFIKKHLPAMIIFAAFSVIFGAARTTAAQTEDLKTPVAGGYSTAEVTDAEVVSSASFAARAQAKKQKAKIKLVAVSRAEKQIVAGTNYRLCLQVETLENDKKPAVPQTVQTIVFRSLKQKYQLTSWAVAACADAMPAEVPVK